MSEEATAVQDPVADEQASMLSDWSGGGEYEVVDEEGNPVGGETQEGENQEEAVQEQADKAPAAPKAQPEKTAEPPKGFGSRFFEKNDETGEYALNTEAALDFLLPKEKKEIFSHPGRQFAETKPQTEPAKEPWQVAFEEHQTKLSKLQEERTTYRKYLQEGLEKTGDWQQASRYADEKVMSDVEEARRKMDYEFRLKDREELMSHQQVEALKAKAAANEAAIMSRFKDAREYGALMYEFGAPIINRLYDMMNPKASEPQTKEQWQSGLEKFWRGIMSDRDMGEFVVDLVQAAWMRQNFPMLVGKAVQSNESQIRKNIRGATRKPSGLKPVLPRGKDEGTGDATRDAWAKWLPGLAQGGDIEV